MEQSRFDRIEAIEVQVDNLNVLKYNVGDRDNLRGAKINAIMLHKVGQYSVAASTRPVIADADFIKATLTLSVNGEESIDAIPLTVFNPADNDGRLFVFRQPKLINWEKSHFDFPTAPSVDTSSIVMTVFYEK